MLAGLQEIPREVEEVLLRGRGVAEVSVIGVPHPDWGEEIMAFVTREPGAAVHFLVMELVDGDDLSDRIARGPVPVEEAWIQLEDGGPWWYVPTQ